MLHTPIKIPKEHNTILTINAKQPSCCIVIKLIKNNTIANNNEHTLNIISVLFIRSSDDMLLYYMLQLLQ